MGWTASLGNDWTVREQLVLRRVGSEHAVAASCTTAAGPLSSESWIEENLASFATLPGAEARPSRTAGEVCGWRLEGQIFTFRWQDRERPMRTKVGLAVNGRRGFSVVVTLPRAEQSLFPSLVRHARLHPDLAHRLGVRD